LFGNTLTKKRNQTLSKIGALIERPDFYNYLTAYQNLELLAAYSGLKPEKKHLFNLLEMVDLHQRHDSKVRTFSQGMKQRLGIAQALLHDPDLIILDEPVNGLDPQGIKDIRNLILRLNRD
ncbi:ATP-binding cassette domain-containing protein, partial [Arthrospira platensis SPKY1]|nr:ATP-binding cassette domain-containing protein [Arthrospira platensis SPKY1]